MKKLFAHIDFLLPGLVLMIFIARFFPFQESFNTYIPITEVSYWGIVLIFVLYGLKLSPKEMLRDLSNWKLHLLTQSATFLIIPLFVVFLYPFFKASALYPFWIALLFLAVLPSTVSMSVIFVDKNKGNLGGAIFNSSISGFLGMVITPLWMSYFLEDTVGSSANSELIVKLIQQIFIPITLGMLVRHFAVKFAIWFVAKLKNIDKIVILLIVYKSFSNAFNKDIFSLIPLSQLMILIAGVVALYLVVFESLVFLSRLIKFKRADTLVVLFCGSQKSLVHGSVFTLLIFPELGMQTLALLPLMIYHAFQLLFASYKTIIWQDKQGSSL
jgi:sodium/bile acid cotransporter 7